MFNTIKNSLYKIKDSVFGANQESNRPKDPIGLLPMNEQNGLFQVPISQREISKDSSEESYNSDNDLISLTTLPSIHDDDDVVEVDRFYAEQRPNEGGFYKGILDGDSKKQLVGIHIGVDQSQYIGQWDSDKKSGYGFYLYKNPDYALDCYHSGQWQENEFFSGNTFAPINDIQIGPVIVPEKCSVKLFYEGRIEQKKRNGLGQLRIYLNTEVYFVVGFWKDGMMENIYHNEVTIIEQCKLEQLLNLLLKVSTADLYNLTKIITTYNSIQKLITKKKMESIPEKVSNILHEINRIQFAYYYLNVFCSQNCRCTSISVLQKLKENIDCIIITHHQNILKVLRTQVDEIVDINQAQDESLKFIEERILNLKDETILLFNTEYLWLFVQLNHLLRKTAEKILPEFRKSFMTNHSDFIRAKWRNYEGTLINLSKANVEQLDVSKEK